MARYRLFEISSAHRKRRQNFVHSFSTPSTVKRAILPILHNRFQDAMMVGTLPVRGESNETARSDCFPQSGGSFLAAHCALAIERNGPPTIGFLAPDKVSWSSWIAAFESELNKLGWIEGRTGRDRVPLVARKPGAHGGSRR